MYCSVHFNHECIADRGGGVAGAVV